MDTLVGLAKGIAGFVGNAQNDQAKEEAKFVQAARLAFKDGGTAPADTKVALDMARRYAKNLLGSKDNPDPKK